MTPSSLKEPSMKLSVSPKKLIIGSMSIAGLVGFICLLDLILKIPFNGQMMFDIMMLVSAALVGFMAWEAYRELN